MCNLSPRLYASSKQLGIGYIFPDPESELETPAKARREKQTSEQRVSVVVFYYHIGYNSFESRGT